ncbi:MAG: hypothetical protein WDO12_09870 [Pseudomonadota bacterium]
MAELADVAGRKPRSRRVQVTCKGERAQDLNAREACPICAHINVSATMHSGASP